MRLWGDNERNMKRRTITIVLLCGGPCCCVSFSARELRPTTTTASQRRQRARKFLDPTTSRSGYRYTTRVRLRFEGEDRTADEATTIAIVPPESDPDEAVGEDLLSISDDSVSEKFLPFGIEPTPDILAIATIYFVEGALGLARLAQTYLLKDELHLGPAELSALSGIFVLPWTIKPIYGFLSDGFPIAGYRRRSYLALAGAIGFLSYSFLSFGLSFLDGVANENIIITSTVVSLLLSSASGKWGVGLRQSGSSFATI